jgi:RNA polymerase sigma-70 factor, ECF subfamily
MDSSVATLAERASAGDVCSFEKLVKLFMRRAYFFCLGLTGNRDDALEVSQNAFVRAWRGIGSLRSGQSFPAWFYAILRREVIRHRGRQNRRGIELPVDDPQVLEMEKLSVNSDAGGQSDLRRDIWRAVDALDLEAREIIIMQHFMNMSYEEISSLLGIPRGSVASKLYRAREELKQKLGGSAYLQGGGDA